MYLLTVCKHQQTILKVIVEDSNCVAFGFLLFHMYRTQAVSIQLVLLLLPNTTELRLIAQRSYVVVMLISGVIQGLPLVHFCPLCQNLAVFKCQCFKIFHHQVKNLGCFSVLIEQCSFQHIHKESEDQTKYRLWSRWHRQTLYFPSSKCSSSAQSCQLPFLC